MGGGGGGGAEAAPEPREVGVGGGATPENLLRRNHREPQLATNRRPQRTRGRRAGADPTKPYSPRRRPAWGWWPSRCTAATSTSAGATAAPPPSAGGSGPARPSPRSGSAASCATAPSPSHASPGRRRVPDPRSPRTWMAIVAPRSTTGRHRMTRKRAGWTNMGVRSSRMWLRRSSNSRGGDGHVEEEQQHQAEL